MDQTGNDFADLQLIESKDLRNHVDLSILQEFIGRSCCP